METTDKNSMHMLRIEAKSSKFHKSVEFPIDETTEQWLTDLRYTGDETGDFVVKGSGAIKMRISIVNRGLEF